MGRGKKHRKSERDCYSLRKTGSSKKNRIKTGVNLIGN